MKILQFNKRLMFILSIVFIALAALLMLINETQYKQYLEIKSEYVEVDCIVVDVDDDKRTITVAYVYKNQTYEVELQTIEYKLMDHFVGVIKPQDPNKLRFDNGYDLWNPYSYVALSLTLISTIFVLLIIKRLLVRLICFKSEKIVFSGFSA